MRLKGQSPGRYRSGVADGDMTFRRVEQLRDECLYVTRRNPGRAEAGADIAGQEIDGLNLHQGCDVAAVGRRIEECRGLGSSELCTHIAA